MSQNTETCGVCGRAEDIVGVAAVPAAPVTISWCRECLNRHCQPLFALEVHVCPSDPEGDPYYDESIEHGMEYAKLKNVKPWEHIADWYLTESTWYKGEYIQVGALLHQLWDAADPSQHVEVRPGTSNKRGTEQRPS